MTAAVLTCLLFALVIGGLGLPLALRLPFSAAERLALGALLGCVATYLFAGAVYLTDLPDGAYWLPPLLGARLLIRQRADLARLFADAQARAIAVAWLILAGWCLGFLALIRNYSGGEWVGDWAEHYHRTLFFLRHQPLDTRFLNEYVLPARPPLANLVAGVFLGPIGRDFVVFQVASTLMATLAFLPAALLARRFRGPGDRRDPVPQLLVIFLLSPLFLQNATFTWTKLPAAGFVLTGIWFLVRGDPSTGDQDDTWTLVWAAVALAAALLTHYSAAPYVLVLGAGWLALSSGRPRPKRAAPALLAATLLLATWFAWSAAHYGVGATLFSNTTATGNAGSNFGDQVVLRLINVRNTLLPHPLRPDPGYVYLEQANALTWFRDWCFNLYQTNLPLALGLGGSVALGLLAWRNRRQLNLRWLGFVAAAALLGIATFSQPAAPDRWGVTHVVLQPLVLLGLTFVAARVPELSHPVRFWLAAGLAIDLAAGIGLQFWAEHLAFPADLFATGRGDVLRAIHGYATWNNFRSKQAFGLEFLGDHAPPAWLIVSSLAALLALSLWRLRGSTLDTPSA